MHTSSCFPQTDCPSGEGLLLHEHSSYPSPWHANWAVASTLPSGNRPHFQVFLAASPTSLLDKLLSFVLKGFALSTRFRCNMHFIWESGVPGLKGWRIIIFSMCFLAGVMHLVYQNTGWSGIMESPCVSAEQNFARISALIWIKSVWGTTESTVWVNKTEDKWLKATGGGGSTEAWGRKLASLKGNLMSDILSEAQ